MKRILISLMIVLSFASCAKHTEAFDNDNDIVAVARCFEFEQVTRSDLQYNEGKGLDFFWAQTDQVGVFGESGSQQVNLKLKEKGEQIVKMYFSITKDYGLIKDKKYVAYCPMTNDMCLKASEVPFSYLGQCQSANSVDGGVGHLGKFDYMYSSPVTAEDNNKAVFDFKHKCSPLYIHITEVPDGVYNKVALKASEAVFTTEGKYNLFEQDSAKAIVEPVMSDEISVTFDGGAEIEGQGEIHAWIMVSPFTLKGKTASLVLTDEGGNESEISIPSNYLGRYRSGKAYKMEVEYQAIQKDPDGSLPGVFSVSATKKVKFSQGNLQYQASTGTWRFAEHQYDFVGDANHGTVYIGETKCTNTLKSQTYEGWIDLFGWGTSGNNSNRAVGESYEPWSVDNPSSSSYDFQKYFLNGKGDTNLSGTNDWGCNIAGNTWRTLSSDELKYITLTREGNRYIKGFITGIDNCGDPNGLFGLFIFPDNFDTKILPNTFNTNDINKYDTYGAPSSKCTLDEFKTLQDNNVVFLPQAYPMLGADASSYTFTIGYLAYWTSTRYSNKVSYYLGTPSAYKMGSSTVVTTYLKPSGMAVRLVTDVNE